MEKEVKSIVTKRSNRRVCKKLCKDQPSHFFKAIYSLEHRQRSNLFMLFLTLKGNLWDLIVLAIWSLD